MYPFIEQIDNNSFNKYFKNSSDSYKLRQRELWKFSGFKKFSFPNTIGLADFSSKTVSFNSLYDNDEYKICFINGFLSKENSDIELLNKDGVEIQEENSNDQYNFDEQKNLFENLNEFHSSNQVIFNVSENIALDKPIVIYYFYQNSNTLYSPRICFNIGDNSKLKIIEITEEQENDSNAINKSLNLYLGKNVKLCHLVFDCGNDFDVSNYTAKQKGFSEYSLFLYQAGSVNNTSNFTVDLLESESSLDANGIFFSDKKNIQNTFFDIHHLDKNTYSNQNFKGIVKDDAIGNFSGKVTIAKDSTQSRSSQLNKNLLLSDYAKAYSRPQLEINNDDVKCSHGSTSSSFNPLELFYLQSRAIPLKDAKKILINAFIGETLLKSCSKNFDQLILKHLENKF